MASRVTRRGHGFFLPGFLFISIAALVGALVAGQFAAQATPQPNPRPTVASVTDQLKDLSKQSSELTEQYNVAQADVAAKQTAAEFAKKRVAKTETDLAAAVQRFRAAVLAQYESPAFSTTGALLTSSDDQDYLSTMSNLTLLASTRGDVVSHYSKVSAANDKAIADADVALAEAAKVRDALRKKKAAVEASIAKSNQLLRSLTAAQQRVYHSRNTVATSVRDLENVNKVIGNARPASIGAAVAVAFALAQVGKRYVYGSSGPNTYDCSGLTSAAWRRAGVSLPHSAAQQFHYGTRVSFEQLQPGDLIFLYRPISHVEIFIGNGLAVSAPQSGESVKVIHVSRDRDYVGATRL